MKKIILSLTLCLSTFAFAASDKSKAAAANKPALGNTNSSTEHNFEDMLVQGKFHFSDEAVTTVEEDKVLDSLIGVRKDFKDRVLMSTTQF